MGTHISKKYIDDVLSAKPEQGKRNLEPLKSFAKEHKLPVTILEDTNVHNDAEVHKHEADLWYCISGEVTFIHGGEMVNPWHHKNPDGTEHPNELKAKEIKNGTTTVLKPGDWLYVPAGEPHQHICKGTARLYIIKIPK